MATPHYYGLNASETAENAVSQNSSPSKELVLIVDLDVFNSQVELKKSLEELQRKIIQSNWPPV
jgi:hypothetical protein